MTRKRVSIFVSGVALVFGLFALAADKLAIWALRPTIREARDLGVEIEIQKVRWKGADISLALPRWGLILPHVPLKFTFHLLPPSIDVIWEGTFLQMTGKDLELSKVGMDFRFHVAPSGIGYFYGEVSAEKIRLGHQVLHSFHLKGSLSETVEFVALAKHESDPVKLSVKGILSEWEAVQQIEGTFSFESPPRVEAKGISFSLAMGNKNIFKFQIPPQALRMEAVTLSEPVVVQAWERDQDQGYFIQVMAPSFSSSLVSEGKVVPLKFSLDFGVTIGKEKISGSGFLRDRDKKINIKILMKGKTSGNIQIQLSTLLSFGEFFSVKDLYDLPEKTFTLRQGDVALQGFIFLKGGHLQRVKGKVQGHGLSGTFHKLPLIELSTIAEAELYPQIKMNKSAKIFVGSLGKDFKLENIEVVYQLLSGSLLTISEVRSHVAGGVLTASPFQVNLKKPEILSQVNLKDFQLDKLLQAVGKDSKIAGTGRVMGTIPLEVKGEGIYFTGAKLRNVEPGVISYRDGSTSHVKKRIEYWDEFEELLAQGNQALVMKALDEFHYDVLELSANRRPKDGLSVELHLKGRNPDLAKGQLFEIRLPITGALESLLKETVWESLIEKDSWEERWKSLPPFR